MISELTRKLSLKADSTILKKYDDLIYHTREYVDDQFGIATNRTGAVEGKMDTVQRLISKIQLDMKERDEALRKIPPNTEQLLKTMRKDAS